MVRVGITGASGFIGRHLRYYLLRRPEVEVITAGREDFASPGRLAEFVANSDIIVHLAGQNRGDAQEVSRTNLGLARRLIEACRASGAASRLIFASSTHISRETPYGISKKLCGEEFRRWSEESGGSFVNLVLPHVFGEGQRPFYNSAVATFCRRLADGDALEVNPGGKLGLIHVREIADLIYSLIESGGEGDVVPPAAFLTAGDLADRLREMDRLYRRHVIPDLQDDLQRDLFNTYRSYLFPGHYPVPIPVREDRRGRLFETVKSLGPGQSFYSRTLPLVTRGNHYHSRKIERFLVLQGKAEIRVRELCTDRVEVFPVNGERPGYVDIPTFHTHTITNVGREVLLTLFWTNEIFNPDDPDTFAEKVDR